MISDKLKGGKWGPEQGRKKRLNGWQPLDSLSPRSELERCVQSWSKSGGAPDGLMAFLSSSQDWPTPQFVQGTLQTRRGARSVTLRRNTSHNVSFQRFREKVTRYRPRPRAFGQAVGVVPVVVVAVSLVASSSTRVHASNLWKCCP